MLQPEVPFRARAASPVVSFGPQLRTIVLGHLTSNCNSRTSDQFQSRTVKKSNTNTAAVRRQVIVKPVVNALEILRYLTRSKEPVRAVDIARQLGINPSTCFNILRTLVREEVVGFDARSKRYSAGPGLASLPEKSLCETRRLRAAKPLMQQVATRFHVTVTLWHRLGQDRIELVGSENNSDDLRIHMAEGQRLPILMGASGRLFAATLGQKDSRMRAAFATLRWSRPLTFETYWREVMSAARCGWAVDDSFFARGIVSVAAPVFEPDGELNYTVSAVLFRGQHDQAGIARLGESLRDLAARLARIFY